MIRYALKIFLLGLLLSMSHPVKAGIEDKLNDAFDVMANATDPSIHMGARRGVITGGSLSIRTPMMNIRPFSIRGPSISMGCGGIDAFFGSFSFISKEQLVQAMRAIVTAAVSYAFQLALTAMCPSCAGELSKLTAELNKANAALTNSCEMTRNFMDDSPIRSSIENAARQFRDSMGLADGRWDAGAQGATNSAVKQVEVETAGGALSEQMTYGNHVWNILKESGEASFGFGAEDFFEEMMSLTGTIIVCTPGTAKCPEEKDHPDASRHVGQQGELVIFRYAPAMNIVTLVNGQATEPKQYSCAGDPEECKQMGITFNPIVGMSVKIREAFLGTPGGELGIITKMRFSYTDEPTAEEIKWMKVGGSLTGTVFRLARKDPGTARGYVQDNADSMAAEVVLGYLDKYMLSAKVAAGRTEQTGMREAYEMIMAASARAHEDAKTFYQAAEAKSQMYVAAKAREEVISK